ncbi:HET-domain-containing protein [Thozetella sp. PMI_491]|nr:HET-domain-containing protein [Thozetella sp. PMI_491]
MRLLNTETFELDSFPAAEDAPPYAILSHTWGHEEVLFEDARHGKEHLHNCGKEGLYKVLRSTSKANHDGYGYIWIDTCCIDKSSSAELSEAINSMFAWYQHSAVCYAYLVDYEHGTGDQLSASRWFTRGWTLQELIAPSDVQFFDSYWCGFGDRTQLCSEITKACSLCQENADLDKVLDLFSISSRMSWASNRRTTRVEDIAYSLLGIFKVTMPLLYGEGARAFQRLQHEIARSSHDQTLLVWSDESGEVGHDELFAPHPSMFRMGSEFRPVPGLLDDHSMAITDKGLEIDAYLLQCTVSYPELANVKHKKWWLAALSCSRVDDDFACAAVLLERTKRASMSFTRSRAEFKTIHGPLLVRYGASTADAPKWPLGEHLTNESEWLREPNGTNLDDRRHRPSR